MNCYISGILWFLLISLLWGRKIVAPPCLVIGKSGLERGPRREFFFFRKVFDRGLWPPSPRSRPRAAETSMESLGPSFGPFLCFPFPFLSFLALSAFLGSPCLPPLPCSPFSPSLVVVVVASPSFAQSPSSQSHPGRWWCSMMVVDVGGAGGRWW